MVNLPAEANSEVDADAIPTETFESDLEIAEDALMNEAETLQSNSEFHRNNLSFRLKIWLLKKYEELVDDFSVFKAGVAVPDTEGDQLNPVKLKKNLLRFGNFINVFEEVLQSLGSIITWQNPAVSFLTFAIYMVVIYKDLLLSTLFFSIVSVFLITYLKHIGWSFGNEVENITTGSSVEMEKDLTIKDQISIIFIVARRAQNYAGFGSDLLEKIRNLLLWREPELTKPVVILFGLAFIGSLFFSIYFLVKMAGLVLGVYIFVFLHLFSRFPRFNQKYNFIEQYLSQLKTDAQYEMELKKIQMEMKKKPKLSRSVSAVQNRSSLAVTPAGSSSSLNTVEASFHDTFQLPVSESVLSAWQNGRRCVLVNKEKYFAVGFKIGRMYLTNNYLCFQRSTSQSESCKTIVVPLETIKTINKARLFHWVPGGGKAIEITMKDTRKVFIFVFQVNVFGPIINRDEAFDSMMVIGTTNEYTWAKHG